MLKNHGQVEKYNHEILGRNSRLDSLNAYVLNEKLKIFNQISKSRIEFTNFYIKIFEDVDFIKINKFSENILLNYFTVLLPKNIRNEFKDELNKNGIEANIYYDKPIHLQNVIIDSNTSLKNNNLVNTENAKLEALTLPLYAFPLKQELQHIKKNLNKLIDQYRNIKL